MVIVKMSVISTPITKEVLDQYLEQFLQFLLYRSHENLTG